MPAQYSRDCSPYRRLPLPADLGPTTFFQYANGVLLTMAANFNGHLGNTTTPSTTREPVASSNGVAVAAGAPHTILF